MQLSLWEPYRVYVLNFWPYWWKYNKTDVKRLPSLAQIRRKNRSRLLSRNYGSLLGSKCSIPLLCSLRDRQRFSGWKNSLESSHSWLKLLRDNVRTHRSRKPSNVSRRHMHLLSRLRWLPLLKCWPMEWLHFDRPKQTLGNAQVRIWGLITSFDWGTQGIRRTPSNGLWSCRISVTKSRREWNIQWKW